MEKLVSTKAKIRFQDCDPFNHLNNAKYIDYFINAREDQIKENYDLDIFAMMHTDKTGWVVASNQIAYLFPAFTMETVVIQSQLIQFSEKTLLVEMTMWNKTLTKLKSLLWAKFIHYDIANQTTLKHSRDLMNLFSSIVVPVPQSLFEERSQYIATTIHPSVK